MSSKTARGFFRKVYIYIKNIIRDKEANGSYNMTELGELTSFLEFLKDDMDFDFDITRFNNRFRLQKLVFFAKSFGWDNDYHYSVYVRGPYSSDLADQYYHMTRTVELIPSTPLPATFNRKKFSSFLTDRDDQWLEAAATIVSMTESYSTYYTGEYLKNKVLERVIDLKDTIPKDIIDSAYSDLLKIESFSALVQA